jgi:glyoxylate reductase
VNGKKLGMVGMGRIGQAVARRAQGFGMQVHYHNRQAVHSSVEKALGATYWEDLEEMLPNVDILSLNCPYTLQTHHLINAERLKLMKADSYLINTARGAVVDEAALTEALAIQRIAGAGLDVYEQEPHMSDALRKLPNVVLLPHISSATIEGRIEMGEKVIVNIKSFVDGHRPPDRVLLEDMA